VGKVILIALNEYIIKERYESNALSGHEFEQTLETVENKRAWHAAVHWVAKTQI